MLTSSSVDDPPAVCAAMLIALEAAEAAAPPLSVSSTTNPATVFSMRSWMFGMPWLPTTAVCATPPDLIGKRVMSFCRICAKNL